MAYSRQPAFSSIPRLYSTLFDAPIATQLFNIAGGNYPQIIFDASAFLNTGGGVVNRITVSACADSINYVTVNAKLVFLCIKQWDNPTDQNYVWNLYKTAYMPSTTVSDTVPNPEIVWEFEGGLPVTNDGGSNFTLLGILASTNYANTSDRGDYLSSTVEYTDNAPF
jgi:hypothetical protein